MVPAELEAAVAVVLVITSLQLKDLLEQQIPAVEAAVATGRQHLLVEAGL
jgi:hypothetical protein